MVMTQNQKIRLIIIEDHQIIREGLVTILNSADDFDIKGHWSTAEEAMSFLEQEEVDVALVDYFLPGMDGLSFTVRMKELIPNLKVIMLTLYDGAKLIESAFDSGAAGFLSKHTSSVELMHTVRTVHKGEMVLSPMLTRQFVAYKGVIEAKSAEDGAPFNNDELRMLQLASDGVCNKEIASCLGISHTALRHRFSAILKKLGASDRTHAVSLALKRGFINLR